MSRDPRHFYVYVADHPVTGEPVYVGKGKNRRFAQHNPAALNGKHVNRYLTNIIRKHGPLEFVVVRDGLSESEAFEAEMALIAQFGRVDIGTGTLSNRTNGGDGTCGYKHTPEWIAAARVQQKGRLVSAETRAKIGAATRGRKITSETRQRLSAAQKGKTKSPEAARKMAEAQRGRTYSPETIAWMSAAKMGTKQSSEHRANIGAALRGRVHTPESRANMSAGIRRSRSAKKPIASDLFAWAGQGHSPPS